MLNEIEMLMTSGASLKNSSRYQDLQFNVADQETELEQRDLTNQCKSVVPAFRHFDFACIGSETCHKQKIIPKLFVDSLQTLSSVGSQAPVTAAAPAEK